MGQDETILVISQPDEQSTDNVLKYLIYFGANFIRINEDDLIESVQISFESNVVYPELFLELKSIDLTKIHSVWYRRGKLNLSGLFPTMKGNILGRQYIDNMFRKEIDRVESFLYSYLKGKKHINLFTDNFISKLVQLEVAQSIGLTIPKTIVTDNASKVLDFFSDEGVLYKTMNFNVYKTILDEQFWSCGVDSSILVTRKSLEKRVEKFGKSFLLSMFQEYIKKRIEIRSFFLFGNFYSMAIFSQQNDLAKVDWRDATPDSPNRVSIFELPLEIKVRLREFMRVLGLNSGSIDLIYTPKEDFVFLEVNPIGQFDWMTKACNFFIEKEIANELRRKTE